MLVSASNCLSLLLAGIAFAPGFTTALKDHHKARPHHVRKAIEFYPEEHARRNDTLDRRAEGARATWYDVEVGLGACGKQHYRNQYTIALNTYQFATGGYPSKRCGQTVCIRHGGKSAEATIQDECPAPAWCPAEAIDLSEGLFEHFAPLSVGVLRVSWNFGGCGDDDPPPPPKTTKKPEPTTTEEEETTTTSSRRTTSSPRPTTTSTVEETTSSSSSTSSLSSTGSDASTTGTATSSGTHTGTASASAGTATASRGVSVSSTGGNINNIYQLVLQLGEIPV